MTEALDNADQTIPNYAFLHPTNVVIHGHRSGESGAYSYTPCATLFFHNDAQPPVMLNVFLHEVFEDDEEMAVQSVAWANRFWNKVSRTVSIFDDGKLIRKHDVMDIIALQDAIEELQEIHRTNINVIH